MKNKRGFEFSFVWIFAILVGALIIFFAIYFAGKIIKTSRYEVDTITARQLEIIFDPMETKMASGKKNSAELSEETRIYDDCSTSGDFGVQEISLSSKSGFSQAWQEPGIPTQIKNKYIFSLDVEQSKKFNFFSKPFKMPFKVSDLIIVSGEKYCFVSPPNVFEDEVERLGLENVGLVNSINECGADETETSVCFDYGGSDCDIIVEGICTSGCGSEYGDYEYGYIRKGDDSVYYYRSLVYGAIFSSSAIYECNIKRLMMRLVHLSLLYKDESGFLATRGCGSGIELGLTNLVNAAKQVENSDDLFLVQTEAESLEIQNDAARCKLW